MAKKRLTPEDAASEWMKLKAEKLELERRLEELKKVLEPYLEKQEERTALLGGFEFKLVDSEREFFKLKEAKENLDGRVLKPYLYTTCFSQIRATWKGGEKKAA